MNYLHKQFENVLTVGLSLAVFILLITVSANQAFQYADSADLMLAASNGGLAHSPGYPLYTLSLALFCKILWFLPSNVSAGWFSALLMALSSGLLLKVLAGISRIFFRAQRVRYEIAVPMVLLWLAVPLNWRLAQVVEIMPLGLLLASSLTIVFLRIVTVKRHARFSFWLFGFIGMIMMLFHPLLTGLVGSLLLSIWLLKKNYPTYWRSLLIGILTGGMVSGCLYLFVSKTTGLYGWETPRTLWQWWLFWSRQIYTHNGSAIESFNGDIRPIILVKSVLLWSKWWLFEQDGIGWIVGIFFGFVFLFKKQSLRIGLWVLFLLIGYGPILAIYVKHPSLFSIAEAGIWWGISLRERMFYIWPVLFLPVSYLGFLYLFVKLSTNRWMKGLLLGGLVILCSWRLIYQYDFGSIRDANAAQLYSTRLLQTLPQNSVLICDSDLLFDIFYAQLNLNLRPDVHVIPVGMILTPSWINSTGYRYSTFGFTTQKQTYVADLLHGGLSQKRRVFLYGIDADVLSFLGLEGNPYYGVPYGYTLEISKNPPKVIESYDYGLSVQLAQMQSPKSDAWFKGFRAHLGGIHAENAYYLSRMGFSKEALWHAQIAKQLFYQQGSRDIVDRSYALGTDSFIKSGSYLNYQPASVKTWIERANQSNDVSEKAYFNSRAQLLDPTASTNLTR